MNNVSKRRALGAIAGFSAIALAFGTALPAQANDPLKVGAILPLTGSLAFLSPPMVAGFWAAVNEVNANGGVNGSKITVTGIKDEGSGGTSPTFAGIAATAHIAEGTQVIIGTASSGRALSIYKQTSGAGALLISPSNTDITLSDVDDNGLYFRTAPSDLLQGRVLAQKILADGKKKVAIIYLQDPYGTGLKNTAKTALTAGKAKVKEFAFAPSETNFTSIVNSVKAYNPDAVVVISYDEFTKIAPLMKSKGFKGNQVYLVDGNMSNYGTSASFGTWLVGAQGTLPGADPNATFRAKLVAAYEAKEDKELIDTIYGAESYDAVIVAALAAIQAKSNKTADIKANMASVTSGGTKVTTFKAAVAALKAGTNIDYDGASGPIQLDSKGNPTRAYMGIYKFGSKGTYKLSKAYLASVPTK
jgi:branched-chain amino acid transport system substrate-binding protein